MSFKTHFLFIQTEYCFYLVNCSLIFALLYINLILLLLNEVEIIISIFNGIKWNTTKSKIHNTA